jgi:hypothetical protein
MILDFAALSWLVPHIDSEFRERVAIFITFTNIFPYSPCFEELSWNLLDRVTVCVHIHLALPLSL